MTIYDVDCVLDIKASVGEGAVWCRASQRLLWVDVWGKTLHRFDPVTCRDEAWSLPERVGCVAPVGPDDMVVGLETGIFSFAPSTQALLPYGLPMAHSIHNRCNDSVVDPSGRLWCGTMNLQGLQGPASGELYSVTGKDRPARHLTGLYLSNGLACSPEGKRLYLSDSHPSVNRIWTFELDIEAGTIAKQQVFFDCAELPGRPDGATVDVDGCYWICAVDGWEILRITPTGKIDRRIPVPISKPSKVAIGGARLDTLFITSIRANIDPNILEQQPQAGGLFALHVGPIGIASPLMHTRI
ncbi:SMP-30/gluconolactonase/LRE family protein [soil metagenome]